MSTCDINGTEFNSPEETLTRRRRAMEWKSDGEGSSEVNSPKKPHKQRTKRDQSTNSRNGRTLVNSGKGTSLLPANDAQTEPVPSELALVLVSKSGAEAYVIDATEDGGSDGVADSNKKQKTDSPETSTRSADLAAAAVQPCRTQ